RHGPAELHRRPDVRHGPALRREPDARGARADRPRDPRRGRARGATRANARRRLRPPRVGAARGRTAMHERRWTMTDEYPNERMSAAIEAMAKSCPSPHDIDALADD